MTDRRPAAVGCMRLSTAPDRDDARAIAVLHAALDAGVTLLDTAQAYGHDDSDRGHNERLIARALAEWPGDRSKVRVATKGGMTRPDGRWVPDGRGKQLAADCESACRALDVPRLDLYQLHAPDPRVPFATSIRSLAALQRNGLVERVGLCNVSVQQIEEARRIVEVASVQVELSLWQDRHFLSGVVRYCLDHDLPLLAHRPLGGPKARARTSTSPVLAAIAECHGVTPFDVALAWLATFGDVVLPIPGVSRVETAAAASRYRTIALTEDERDRLDALCPAARAARDARGTRTRIPSRPDVDVVLIMGLPGAGKSTVARELVARGYVRLNRDDAGGSLRSLLPALDAALQSDAPGIVLDNTYVSRVSRAVVVQAAAARGAAVRCVWLTTSPADAQVNAATRIVETYGRLLDAAELASVRRRDPAALGPMTVFRYQRELEPPDVREGFARVESITFSRRPRGDPENRAVVIWCDGVLVRSAAGERVPVSVADVVVDPGRGEVLRRYAADGYRLLGLSWQPQIEAGERAVADVHAVFARMNALLGVSVEVHFCPHGGGPPKCWCRKPLPGLPVLLSHLHRFDPARSVYVGDGTQDLGYAGRLGFTYLPAEEFFAV